MKTADVKQRKNILYKHHADCFSFIIMFYYIMSGDDHFYEGTGMVENKHCVKNEYSGKTPLVSVIIPVYNVSLYLRHCLDSVVAQTYRNLEIILVDDGSRDDSGSICDQYAETDQRIQVLHTANRGLSAARNLALDIMTGSYIFFLDSDDWIERDIIETFVSAAEQTQADIVSARIWLEYQNQTLPARDGSEKTQSFCGEDIVAAYSGNVFRTSVWNKLFRSECFHTIRFPVGQNYEDAAILWKVVKNLAENGGRVTALPVRLFHFRIRKSSISHTSTFPNIDDCWKANLTKFKGLRDYDEHFIQGCFVVICMMWANYSGFSKDDKARAEATVLEMESFSRKHFREIIRGDFPRIIKITCILSQKRNHAVMRICFCARKVLRGIEDRKWKMFE